MARSKTALACPPKLEDYPPYSVATTAIFAFLMFSGWIASWLAQVVFTFTVGWFLSKPRLELWNGYLFRSLAAWPPSYLTPGIRTRKTATSWQPSREMIDGRKSVLVVANHRSFMDPFTLGAALLPLETKYVAKADLFDIPFGGWSMRRAGDLPVRFDKNKNQGWGTVKGSVSKLLLQATEHFTHGNSIIIFPEGTRMGYDLAKAQEAADHPSKLAPFKLPFFDLAKKLNVPVVCVAARGTDDVWPVGSNAMRPAEITIDVAEPLDPAAFADGQAIADAARDKIGQMYLALCRAE